MRLLILTASVGNGHMSAAKALELAATHADLEVLNINCLDFTGKAFKTWYQGGYEMLVRRGPSVWGHFYRSSDKEGALFRFQSQLDAYFCRTLEPIIADFRPDWVLCAHSLPQPTLGMLREKYGYRVAVGVTDLHPHLMWLRGKPDYYFVPTDYSLEALRKRAEDSPADVTGIPISSEFSRKERLENKQILVTAGGIGGGPLTKVARAVASLDVDTKIVTGRNERAYKSLTSLELPPKVQVLGAVSAEEMAHLMRSSSFMIGKPGGLTTFECLASGLPLLIYEPLVIPGQEEDNAAYMDSVGAAMICGINEDLAYAARELLQNEDRLHSMRLAALSHAKPDAAERVVDRLVAL